MLSVAWFSFAHSKICCYSEIFKVKMYDIG